MRLLNPTGSHAAGAVMAGLVRRKDRRTFEQLDTPAFLATQVDDAVAILKRTSEDTLPLVVAHHNLLPQVEPRVQPYGELIDGGLVRGRLAGLDRPLLYLHGHTHKGRMEVVTEPSTKWSRIICVGAPSLVDGFNLVRVEFSQGGYPVGCVVERHRRRDSVMEVSTERVPLWPAGLPGRARLSYDARVLYDSLAKEFRVAECAEGLSAKDVAPLLLELEWFGLVRLEHEQGDDVRLWSGRRMAS